MGKKQAIRATFREAVFKRDGRKCRICKKGPMECELGGLDAHHITDRNEMPNGGYVKENGITLCPKCHVDAEQFHISGGKTWLAGRHPDDLYKMIGSSKEEAIKASEKLAKPITYVGF